MIRKIQTDRLPEEIVTAAIKLGGTIIEVVTTAEAGDDVEISEAEGNRTIQGIALDSGEDSTIRVQTTNVRYQIARELLIPTARL